MKEQFSPDRPLYYCYMVSGEVIPLLYVFGVNFINPFLYGVSKEQLYKDSFFWVDFCPRDLFSMQTFFQGDFCPMSKFDKVKAAHQFFFLTL